MTQEQEKKNIEECETHEFLYHENQDGTQYYYCKHCGLISRLPIQIPEQKKDWQARMFVFLEDSIPSLDKYERASIINKIESERRIAQEEVIEKILKHITYEMSFDTGKDQFSKGAYRVQEKLLIYLKSLIPNKEN